jgi:hypothetical protein
MSYRIPDDVVFHDLAEEAVILNLKTGKYFGLNGVGTRLWHLLAEGCPREQLYTMMLSEYEVEEAELRRDVDELLRQLSDYGLVESDAKGTPANL